MSGWIHWLDEAGAQDTSRVGGKVANLSHLSGRYPVPPGFCLTTQAYQVWAGQPEGSGGLPPALAEALGAAYAEMGRRCGDGLRVAVRSSAVDEDGRFASFAGQYETFLNLDSLEGVTVAVARCWASTRSARVREYRERYGLPAEGLPMAVLVQQLVPADAAAVVFSANPVTRDRGEVVINASWGLGESIVGGTVTPDTFAVRKSDLRVTRAAVADKERMTVMVDGGTQEVAVPRFLRSRPSLSEEKLVETARLAMALEEEMRWPVDVECAYREDQLYLLQCRLITTLIEPEP